jgi:hypothetical protein
MGQLKASPKSATDSSGLLGNPAWQDKQHGFLNKTLAT